jgi:hypothetical protein
MVGWFRLLIAVGCWGLPFAPAAFAQDPSDGELERWVAELGHDQYLRRERASRKLAEMGAAAIDPLLVAMRAGDLEVVERGMEVITEVAIANPPSQDGGAWEKLGLLAAQGTGQIASRAEFARDEVRLHRAGQARVALKSAGVFIGVVKRFALSTAQHTMAVRIDNDWNGELDTLQWLQWLDGVQNASVHGKAVTRQVLARVVEIPDLKSISIIDGKVDVETLQPLQQLTRIYSLEFRYVDLTDECGDLIAALPIRLSLELMGTGISKEVVDELRETLPGLPINHRQGGFLGVECSPTDDVCEITSVVPDSAAQRAGLLPASSRPSGWSWDGSKNCE